MRKSPRRDKKIYAVMLLLNNLLTLLHIHNTRMPDRHPEIICWVLALESHCKRRHIPTQRSQLLDEQRNEVSW